MATAETPGFTPDDVALLRLVADCNERDNIALWSARADDMDGSKAVASLRALADRIAARLQPE